jgi:hypothetical protein
MLAQSITFGGVAPIIDVEESVLLLSFLGVAKTPT